MRLVIDTNILISALFRGTSLPSHLISLWQQGVFDLLCCDEQIDKIARVTRYPKLQSRISPALAGRLVNQLRELALFVENLPKLDVCDDPYDNYLLALAVKGAANFVLTGDKRDVLKLGRYQSIRIVTARDFLTVIRHLP